MVDVKKVKQGRANSFSQKNLGVEANIGLGLFDFFTIQTNNSLSSYAECLTALSYECCVDFLEKSIASPKRVFAAWF